MLSSTLGATGRALRQVRWSTRLLLLAVIAVFLIGLNISDSVAVATENGSPTISSPVQTASPGRTYALVGDNDAGASPADYAESASEESALLGACEYLTYCRWWHVNAMPIPNVGLTSMSQLPSAIAGGLAQFMFAIAALGMFLVGMALTFVMSIDLLSRALYSADYLYAIVSARVLGMDSATGSAALAVIILSVLVFVGVRILLPGVNKAGFDLGTKSLAMSLVGVVALGIMTVQASKNHNGIGGSADKAPIAAKAAGDGSDIDDLSLQSFSTSNDPNDWAFLSPGWFVIAGQKVANEFGGVVSGTVSDIATTVGEGGRGDLDGHCRDYLEAMHHVFSQTKAVENLGGKENVLLAYDDLMIQLYFANYREAAFGDTRSAHNSWCRAAENQSSIPTGDQVLLTRLSGDWGWVVGEGAVGPLTSVDEEPATSGDKKYAYVTKDGQWTDRGKEVAGEIFGPVFHGTNRDWGDPGVQQIMFFAACDVNTGSTNVNGAWSDADVADADRQIESKDCSEVLSKSDGFGSDSDEPHRFGYREEDGWFVVGPLFGWGAGSGAEKLKDDEALKFYQTVVLGSNSSTALILAFISLALIWLTIRYFGPVILGAMFTQALAVAAMIALTIFLILLVIPSQMTRRIFMTTLKSVAASLIVVSLVGILFAFTLLMVILFTELLTVDGASGVLDALLAGFGAVLGFWVVRTAVHSFTNLNLGSVSGGLQVAFAGASPALQNFGFDATSPLDRDFWSWRKRHQDPDAADLTTDLNSPVQDMKPDDKKDLLVDPDEQQPKKRTLADAAGPLSKVPGPVGWGAKGIVAANQLRDAKNKITGSDETDLAGASHDPASAYQAFRSALLGGAPKGSDAHKSELLDNLVPLRPDLSPNALDKSLVALPTAANLRRLAQTAPGVRSAGTGGHPMTPAEAESMLNLQRQQALSMDHGFDPGTDPVDRASSVAWMGTADLMAAQAGYAHAMASQIDPSTIDLGSPMSTWSMPELPPMEGDVRAAMDQSSLFNLDPAETEQAYLNVMSERLSSMERPEEIDEGTWGAIEDFRHQANADESVQAEDVASWTNEQRTRFAQVAQTAAAIYRVPLSRDFFLHGQRGRAHDAYADRVEADGGSTHDHTFEALLNGMLGRGRQHGLRDSQ